jgi:hypothetical protein
VYIFTKDIDAALQGGSLLAVGRAPTAAPQKSKHHGRCLHRFIATQKAVGDAAQGAIVDAA